MKSTSFHNVAFTDASLRNVCMANVAIADANLEWMTLDGVLVTDLLAAYLPESQSRLISSFGGIIWPFQGW